MYEYSYSNLVNPNTDYSYQLVLIMFTVSTEEVNNISVSNRRVNILTNEMRSRI
jgi:RNase P/RNase MRP subunit p30